jgi:hypothetical protein
MSRRSGNRLAERNMAKSGGCRQKKLSSVEQNNPQTENGRPEGRPFVSLAMSGRYPRRVCRLAGCITIAATLRQTAAPHANVKSEIHMA